MQVPPDVEAEAFIVLTEYSILQQSGIRSEDLVVGTTATSLRSTAAF